MWGGNAFLYAECEDNTWPNDGTDPVPDLDGNTNCDPYEADPTTCGAFDSFADITIPAVLVDVICCICGGGSFLQTSSVSQEQLPTDLSSGTFDLGHRDLYVIYPTTEKPLNDLSTVRTIDFPTFAFEEFPNAGNNTVTRTNECTKIYGFEAQDTIQLRLDDPSVEDAKFTNDDDECALEIDGWEVIWRLGDDWTDGEVSLDVHFSRKDKRAVICAFPDSFLFRRPTVACVPTTTNEGLYDLLVPT